MESGKSLSLRWSIIHRYGDARQIKKWCNLIDIWQVCHRWNSPPNKSEVLLLWVYRCFQGRCSKELHDMGPCLMAHPQTMHNISVFLQRCVEHMHKNSPFSTNSQFVEHMFLMFTTWKKKLSLNKKLISNLFINLTLLKLVLLISFCVVTWFKNQKDLIWN